jgi:hypothetical protein
VFTPIGSGTELSLTNLLGRAHNPEGNGSKPFSATYFCLFDYLFLPSAQSVEGTRILVPLLYDLTRDLFAIILQT